MQNFTYSDFIVLQQNENKLKELLMYEVQKEQKKYAPKQQTINNILNYSKALSIRKSNNVEHIKMVLN